VTRCGHGCAAVLGTVARLGGMTGSVQEGKSREWVWAAWAKVGRADAVGLARRLEWGTELIVGARLSEKRGRGSRRGRREPKGKTYSRGDATDARARWAGRGSFSLRGQRGQLAGWAKGRVGRKVCRAENKEKEFLN
jgi:hypothetical protein